MDEDAQNIKTDQRNLETRVLVWFLALIICFFVVVGAIMYVILEAKGRIRLHVLDYLVRIEREKDEVPSVSA